MCSGKLSEGGLLENICLITEIKYSKEDKDSFKIFKNQLLQGTANNFKTIDREDIILLAKNGEILSRIIDRKIPSISELYGNKEQSIGEQVYDEGANLGLFNVEDLDNVDIEFDDGIELRKNVELEVEKEAKKDILETTKTEKEYWPQEHTTGKPSSQSDTLSEGTPIPITGPIPSLQFSLPENLFTNTTTQEKKELVREYFAGLASCIKQYNP